MKPSAYIEFQRGGWEGLIAPEYEQGIKQLFTSSTFPSPDFPGTVEEVHSNVGRTYRVYVRSENEHPDFYAKSFQAKGIIHFLENKFVLASAERSWKAAHLLAEAGVLIPRPVAFARMRKWGLQTRSVYISGAINGARDGNLQNYFVKNFDEARLSVDRVREKRIILQKLAELYVRAHSQDRVYLPDFHPHNMLWHKDEEGNYRLYLMDFDEVRFRLRRDDRLKNLTSLCRNADKIVKKMNHNVITTTDRLRFLRHYLGPSSSSEDLHSLWKKILSNWNLK